MGIGKIDDFEVRAVYNAFSNVAPIEFTFVCYNEDSKKIELVNRLIDKKIKYLTCDYNAYGITISTNGFTASKCIEKLDDLLNMVVENLKELEFKGSAGIYLYAANKICANNDIQLSGIQAFKFCFNNVEEFSKAFEYDLALQILFIICGMGYNVYLVNKQVKRVKNI